MRGSASRLRIAPTVATVLALQVCAVAASGATVSGSPVTWHRVTVDFQGPSLHELGSGPNPFLDYRLQVRFTSPDANRVYDVPGFFDGDGGGGASGATWRVRFAPDAPGTWSYAASFRSGAGVAVSPDPLAGAPSSFDGESGTFVVSSRDTTAPGFLRYGRLESIGRHHLKLRDGEFWVKLGTNNPENLLGYAGFDNTPYASHTFASHIADWNVGDPDWDSPDRAGAGDGRGIIGALNYVAEQGLNSIYFMPMNIGADGMDVWPYASTAIQRDGSASNDNLHFDLSKLAQWEIVFAHAQRLGLALHWVLSDKTVANKNELDNATLGVERKLFYREMVARFAHHNALQWNLCEEYNLDLPLPPNVIDQFGEYLADVDPYDHPITVHSHGNTYREALDPFLAESWFKVMSVQTWQRPEDIEGAVEYFRAETARVGNPIPVQIDECIGMNQLSATEYRKRTFWDALLSGGGFEMFKSYGDSDMDDFRVYEPYFRYANHARRFVQEVIPFASMSPADDLVTGEDPLHGGAEVLSLAGEVYAIYLPRAAPAPTLNLGGIAGTFEQSWFNPRTGEFEGSPRMLAGGAPVGLGSPPADANEDWVVLVESTARPPARSNGQPAGTLPSGTVTVTLDLDTDIGADCRHAAAPGVEHAAMTAAFSSPDGRHHAASVDGLGDGRAYAYHVRCATPAGVANTDDYAIAFVVDSVDPVPIGDRAVWYLDEGFGALAGDATGGGGVGTLLGLPDWDFGYRGAALRFDGIGDLVRVEDSARLDFSAWAGASVAAWVRPLRLGHSEDQTIFGHWSDSVAARTFQILISPDDRLRCRTNHDDGFVTTPTPLAADVWTHVACVWSPAGLSIHLDGALVATDPAVEATLAANGAPHVLGARDKDGALSQFFGGTLDEVHVFGRALTAEEVARLYASVPCMDADRDGVRACEGDCNDANPDCMSDCTDADADGVCAPLDCDDAVPSAGSVPFPTPIRFDDRDTLTWAGPADVRWRRGDLSRLEEYITQASGSLYAASAMDVAADVPLPAGAFYYLLRNVGCGSWQSAVGAQPGRDADLPLP